MMRIRKASERGHADHGWLKSAHSFSFADYYDPEVMGFRTLRVINEDYIAGGAGFPTHPHRDMEIITYIVDGALEHKDSMGNTAIVRPGEVQRMSAGTGVRHSEFNSLKDKTTHLLQIWILTEKEGMPPSYEQKSFLPKLKDRAIALVASRDGREDSVTVHQDVNMYAGRFQNIGKESVGIAKGRSAWLQVVSGNINVNGNELHSGDGLACVNETNLAIDSKGKSEFLIFDMA